MTLPNLRTAARPFVVRALRGGRGRRLVGLSLILAALSGAMGTWLALGTGDFEREVREALDLEENRYHREHVEFTLVAEDEDEAAAMRREIARDRGPAFGEPTSSAGYRARGAVENGGYILYAAAFSDAPRGFDEVRQEAQRSWQAWSANRDTSRVHQPPQPVFNWYDEDEVKALRAVIASGNVPKVERYASPLGLTDALRLAGAFAGGALVVLLMLAAPVLAGTQMAQETHENTLQPLAGSALRSDELALGLTAGPLAITAVLAAPQLLILLAAAVAVGHVGPALGLLFVALAGGAFLVALSQLAGLALGKLRSPGLVGGGLAAVFGILGGVGLAFAGEIRSSTSGVLALLPQAAASHSLAQTFDIGPQGIGFGAAHDTTVPVLVGAFGMVCFAVLGLRALARRLGQTELSALRGGEAFVAAAVAMLLVSLANQPRSYSAEQFYLANLGLLVIPFSILLMMRAPTGDVPPSLRRTPVARLVGEFALWSLAYLAAAGALVGVDRMHVLASPVAALYLAWFLGVAGLVSLRVAVTPLTFASRLWVGVCTAAVAVAFGHVVIWSQSASEFAYRTPPLFVFSELSPVLGLVQAVLTLVIPWTLIRALTRPAPAAV